MKLLIISLLINLFIHPTNDITGVWDANKDNTLVRIYENNNICYGEILSSDNATAKKGTIILKNLKFKSGKWIGEFYSIKFNKSFDAEIIVENNILKIKIQVKI